MTDDERLTIGAFARAANVTPSALRFYDDCGLVRPVAVDTTTGYRYYSPGQLDEVLFIRRLREAGLPLADVRRVLAGPPDLAERVLIEHLRDRERAVEAAAGALAMVRQSVTVRSAFTVSGPVLAGAIRQVAPAADPGGEFPVLAGVLIETDATEVRLVATDRYRLALRSLCATDLPGEPASTVVPAGDLASATSWFTQQASVRVELSGRGVRFCGDSEHRVLSAIGESFPAYRVVLDGLPEPATTVVAPRAAMLAAIGDAPGVRVDLMVDAVLRIEPSTVIGAEITGAPIAVSFLGGTLRAALDAGIGPDVLLRISRPDQPVLARSADDGSLTTLIMPVKRGNS